MSFLFEGETDDWLRREQERLRDRLDEVEDEIRRRLEKGSQKEWKSSDNSAAKRNPRFRSMA